MYCVRLYVVRAQQSKLSSTRKQLEQEFEQKQRELLRLLDALGELTLDCDDLVNKLADVYDYVPLVHTHH